MTWYLPAGKAVVLPELRTLVAEAVLCMLSELDMANDMEFQVPVFDDLAMSQKVILLRKVAFGLMDPETPAIEHTAALEGCIAAVFNLAAEYLENEFRSEADQREWRSMINTAYKAYYGKRIPKNSRYEKWRKCLDTLESEIHRDSGWNLAPDRDTALLGIPSHYFTVDWPLPQPDTIQALRQELVQFCEKTTRK